MLSLTTISTVPLGRFDTTSSSIALFYSKKNWGKGIVQNQKHKKKRTKKKVLLQ